MMMNRKILFVDDEQNILSGIERAFRHIFEVVTANGGKAALVKLKMEGPFAVVVSDYRMPEMNGTEFLAQCLNLAPDTVRIMLTGQADLEQTIQAINEGNIFRFLLKPCAFDSLTKTLEAGLKQYQLIMAEHDLLEKTLKGTIKVLMEILALANPVAFSRTAHICHLMRKISTKLGSCDPLEIEFVGMLSQIEYCGATRNFSQNPKIRSIDHGREKTLYFPPGNRQESALQNPKT